MPATAGQSNCASDRKLRLLNEQYIKAYMKSDVGWYRKHLAGDFVCIESDGLVLGKAEFLKLTAKAPEVAAYKLDQVNVRIYGAVAVVQATGSFIRKDGSRGRSCYIDVYVQERDEWKVVSAQVRH
jgi:hypothetical protein